MYQDSLSNCIASVGCELSIEIATTLEQLLEAKRLRYKVYCEDRGFEAGADGLEQDVFDSSSQHALVRSRATGAVLGTVRVVLASADSGEDSFPMQRVCENFVLAPLPLVATGEISRFALTRDRPGISRDAAAMMRLCLMRGIVEISGQNGLTHWCAVMERSLVRLLSLTGIHFVPVGPTIEFHGTRQPVVGAIGTVLGRIRGENAAVWSFITDNGALWSEPEVPELLERCVA